MIIIVYILILTLLAYTGRITVFSVRRALLCLEGDKGSCRVKQYTRK